MSNPGNGPAKGPGNGNPAKPFTKRDGDNPGYLAIKMRHWKEKQLRENPDYVAPERPLNAREFRELAKAAAPEALQTLVDIHSDPKQMALARVRASEIIQERAHGKPEQPVVQERKLDELSDAELREELRRVLEEEGVTIELTGESYRDVSGTAEAGEPAFIGQVVRDGVEGSGSEAAGASLAVDREA